MWSLCRVVWVNWDLWIEEHLGAESYMMVWYPPHPPETLLLLLPYEGFMVSKSDSTSPIGPYLSFFPATFFIVLPCSAWFCCEDRSCPPEWVDRVAWWSCLSISQSRHWEVVSNMEPYDDPLPINLSGWSTRCEYGMLCSAHCTTSTLSLLVIVLVSHWCDPNLLSFGCRCRLATQSIIESLSLPSLK